MVIFDNDDYLIYNRNEDPYIYQYNKAYVIHMINMYILYKDVVINIPDINFNYKNAENLNLIIRPPIPYLNLYKLFLCGHCNLIYKRQYIFISKYGEFQICIKCLIKTYQYRLSNTSNYKKLIN
jgi:hypothetical protein